MTVYTRPQIYTVVMSKQRCFLWSVAGNFSFVGSTAKGLMSALHTQKQVNTQARVYCILHHKYN